MIQVRDYSLVHWTTNKVTKFPDIAEFGLIRTMDDKIKRDFGYKTFAFNAFVSDKIGIFRDLPDTRNKM